eukprot:CAMPEP_0116020968 /NCGR_PEP_ID=MMETSP0321-20121206/10108_1 /TAXON_ID=163516 /ORGANISM="Leptocylindrus danicus var. danicus, Strain B650" /LENGTH=33 /DNA_ID= /DNA_START= /DNA_END= /DNA_ORIENTATION=
MAQSGKTVERELDLCERGCRWDLEGIIVRRTVG